MKTFSNALRPTQRTFATASLQSSKIFCLAQTTMSLAITLSVVAMLAFFICASAPVLAAAQTASQPETLAEVSEQTKTTSASKPRVCTVQMQMGGAIGAGSLALLEKGLAHVERQGCQSLLILINTPGGSLDSTRRITEKILNSPVPILCFVHPAGAHAGSAGAIILQACHVNGAIATTNLGAATPISGTGQEISEDLRKKLLNDTTSWMDGMTSLRGRSQKFGRDIIVEAKAVAAEEALKIGAIDFVGTRIEEFLDFAQGRVVKMSEGKEQKVEIGVVQVMELSLADRILALLADPQIAYLLFMGSLALLYFEITHPGTLVAGVIGGLGLVVALIALHKLDVTWGALLLLTFGLGLLIAEAFLPSFGILGVGGIVSFVLGSIFLFDPQRAGFQLPLPMVISTAGTLGLIMFGLGVIAFRTMRLKPTGGGNELLGFVGMPSQVGEDKLHGFIEVNGEIWQFQTSEPVTQVDQLEVVSRKGLKLMVKKV